MILLIVGTPGSGKTTAARIAESLGFRTIYASDIIREEIKSRDLPYTSETDRMISDWFHKNDRERLFVERLIPKLLPDTLNVIEGFRSPKQLKYLRELTDQEIKILSIDAPFEERLKRLIKRHRFENIDGKYLRERDQREFSLGLKELMNKADYRIHNDLSLAEFKERVKEILRGLK